MSGWRLPRHAWSCEAWSAKPTRARRSFEREVYRQAPAYFLHAGRGHRFPRDAHRDAYVVEAALQNRPMTLLVLERPQKYL